MPIRTSYHQSATCVVLKSEDVWGRTAVKKRVGFSDDSGGGSEAGGQYVSKGGGMRRVSKSVVIKLMMNEDQYEREVKQREGLDGRFVMGIVARSDQLKDRWEKEVALFNFPKYRFGIVMPAAERNLMVTLLQERMNFEVRATCR